MQRIYCDQCKIIAERLFAFIKTIIILHEDISLNSTSTVTVKKSSLRVLCSNSKFNANKLKREGGKKRGIKLPKTLAKKKILKNCTRQQ